MNLTQPKIMGILNITPDSFYKDSRINPNDEAILEKATKMVSEGVDIFDVGGLSSRPGSKSIPINEEIDRVVPAIQSLKKHFPEIPVSIDTFRAEVAKEAIKNGASIVNDISAGEFDENMFGVIQKYNPVYIMMHQQGEFDQMHKKTDYQDFLPEVLNSLYKKANRLRSSGVNDIVIDPGFGFSKSIEDNYLMLKKFEIFQNPVFPILIGVSRKSMLYKPLGSQPEDIIIPTVFFEGLLSLKGAKILRVHDVKPIKDLLKLILRFNFI